MKYQAVKYNSREEAMAAFIKMRDTMNMHSIQIMECNIAFVLTLTRVFGKMELMSLVFITIMVKRLLMT